jgi:hypothetical protein
MVSHRQAQANIPHPSKAMVAQAAHLPASTALRREALARKMRKVISVS